MMTSDQNPVEGEKGMELVETELIDELVGEVVEEMLDKEEGQLQPIEGIMDEECLEGVERDSLVELEMLYKNHANALGFCYKKHTQRVVDGVVVEKYYACSCEGESRAKLGTPTAVAVVNETTGSKRRRRKVYPIKRTGCRAQIRVKLVGNRYQVVRHVIGHNHPFTRKEWQYLQRSERHISNETGQMIESMEAAGLKPTQGYKYIAHEFGGETQVGHLPRDHINYVNRLRLKKIEAGDAQTVLDMLQQRSEEDPDFFFRMKIGIGNRLKALFWRDGMMKEDYMLYGDAVVLDITFKTNRYELICAPIVGCNNHSKNDMFGCAFIPDETTETFEWVLLTFLKSMGGRVLISIFTDQDAAMAAAIKKVLPNTRHRLCQWHLQQNAIKHYGALKKNIEFKRAFEHCLRGCTSPEEFEQSWVHMITTYKLENEPWFARLYKSREKWCTGLNKDFFSAGMLATQRSESTNNALKFNANKTTSLTQFLNIFEETVERWRSVERQDEHNCIMSIPNPTKYADAALLRHAAEVYTLKAFEDFKIEFNVAMATAVYQIYDGGYIKYYEVLRESRCCGARKEVVMFTILQDSVEVACSCKGFEETKMLCFHCIRYLHLHSIGRIPEKYIAARWTKNAKKSVRDRFLSKYATSTARKDSIVWRQNMLQSFFQLITKSEGNLDARKLLEDALQSSTSVVLSMLPTKSVVEQPLMLTESSSAVSESTSAITEEPASLHDPLIANTKGRKGKRHKSCLERHGKSKNEIGTITPKAQLF